MANREAEFSARQILAGQAPPDMPVTVKGWVRTRRDSKAGISFLHLSVGSSFHPVQMLARAIHRFFDETGFFWVNPPIITASDAEGAGALFRVSTLDLANLPRTPQGKVDFAADFFGREAFLTVSGQLDLEAYCLALTKVYTSGPTFRADNSNTSRHLADFWMIEPEIAFADLSDNASLAGALSKYTFAALLH